MHTWSLPFDGSATQLFARKELSYSEHNVRSVCHSFSHFQYLEVRITPFSYATTTAAALQYTHVTFIILLYLLPVFSSRQQNVSVRTGIESSPLVESPVQNAMYSSATIPPYSDPEQPKALFHHSGLSCVILRTSRISDRTGFYPLTTRVSAEGQQLHTSISLTPRPTTRSLNTTNDTPDISDTGLRPS